MNKKNNELYYQAVGDVYKTEKFLFLKDVAMSQGLFPETTGSLSVDADPLTTQLAICKTIFDRYETIYLFHNVNYTFKEREIKKEAENVEGKNSKSEEPKYEEPEMGR